MKTEKRLTMALSVLVALMMLAVPLASSSNLFVDGGQTNSNGDAPSLGASTGYTVTFQLNADGKSLDQVSEQTLDTLINGLNNDTNPNYVDGATWYLDENGDMCALILPGKTVYVEQLIWALCTQPTLPATVAVFGISKEGYTLDSWKNESTGATYGPITSVKPTTGSEIKKDMTFASQWTLSEGFVEVPVKVTFDGETKDYVKAYDDTDDDKKVTISPNTFPAIPDVSDKGYIIGDSTKDLQPVYTHTLKDANGNDYTKEAKDMVITNNSLIVDYTLKPIYTKVTVNSAIFEETITLYANVGIAYTYNDVFNTLTWVTNDDGEFIFNPSPLTSNSDVKSRPGTLSFDSVDGSILVNDKQYKATTWNGSKLLYSTENAVADLTLDATLNSYKVVFMVNGQYEVVDIPFGELSADKCTLDVTGINRWVVPTDSNYTAFKTFNFTDEEIKTIEDNASQNSTEENYELPVLIAVFTSSSSTAYAVFDASDLDETIPANFGNEKVEKIVVPGKDKDAIPNLSTPPEIEGKYLFMGWQKITTVAGDTIYSDYNAETDKYDKTKVVNFCADWTKYESSITFNGDNSVNGVFYYSLKTVPVTNDDIISSLVAVEYDGKLYKAPADATDDDKKAFNDVCNKVLTGSKDGYYVNQWKDADGKVVIDKVNKITLATADHAISGISVKVTDIKGDVNFYANFVPEDYLIIYYANTATASNTMVQVGTVDEGLALFGESTFGNEGYVLKEWNTRPDGKGTSYALGSDFTLNGTQYKDAANVPVVTGIPTGYDKCVTLYAIWEKVGGSDVPGGNTGGDNGNDNTALYLIAGMLAVIAVLAIVGIVLMRKK